MLLAKFLNPASLKSQSFFSVASVKKNSPSAKITPSSRAIYLLLMVFLCGGVAHAAVPEFSKNIGIRANLGVMFDNNVTRAQYAEDQLSDLSYSANLSMPFNFSLTDHTRLVLTGFVGAEKFAQYTGLSRTSGGFQGELQYRSSGEFTAPTFAIFARTSVEQYQSTMRDGSRNSFGVSMQFPLTDRIQTYAAVAYSRRKADSNVFNIGDASARLGFDYALSASNSLYLSGELHSGDIVTTRSAYAALYNVANAYAADDAFPGLQRYSYRVEGTTVQTTLGYNLGISASQSLDFSWRLNRVAAAMKKYNGSYAANQFFIVYLVSF